MREQIDSADARRRCGNEPEAVCQLQEAIFRVRSEAALASGQFAGTAEEEVDHWAGSFPWHAYAEAINMMNEWVTTESAVGTERTIPWHEVDTAIVSGSRLVGGFDIIGECLPGRARIVARSDVSLSIGSEEWADTIVEADVTLHAGSVEVAVHDDASARPPAFSIAVGDPPCVVAARVMRLQVQVLGRRFRVAIDGQFTYDEVISIAAPQYGRVTFRVPAGSIIEFANIRSKVLRAMALRVR